jgi:Domain of unknown function DUF29
MATQTEQPKTVQAPGYEQDFYLWCYRMAELIRAGRFDEVDRENVAEEIESLARRDLAELKNRTTTLLTHLLKRDYQPQKHTRSWDVTIGAQRRRIQNNMGDIPSLRRRLPALIHEQYEQAVAEAIDQTGLGRKVFPAVCPYTTAEVYGDWVEK